MKTVELQNIVVKLLKSFFASKKQTSRVSRAPKTAVKKSVQKNVSYKVNQKVCEQYLLDKMVDAGMHNLTSKFHKKK